MLSFQLHQERPAGVSSNGGSFPEHASLRLTWPPVDNPSIHERTASTTSTLYSLATENPLLAALRIPARTIAAIATIRWLRKLPTASALHVERQDRWLLYLQVRTEILVTVLKNCFALPIVPSVDAAITLHRWKLREVEESLRDRRHFPELAEGAADEE